VHRMIVAVIDPANTPHGYNWTFAFPMLLFIVIAVILYALFSRPHRRVPARRISAVAAASGAVTSSHAEASGAPAAASTTAAAAGPAAESASDGAASPAADSGEGTEVSE
jgi:hypothetical protein